MSKDKSTKYPTLRVRVSQEQFDKAYRIGWPDCVKEFINNTPEKTNVQENNNRQAANIQQDERNV